MCLSISCTLVITYSSLSTLINMILVTAVVSVNVPFSAFLEAGHMLAKMRVMPSVQLGAIWGKIKVISCSSSLGPTGWRAC